MSSTGTSGIRIHHLSAPIDIQVRPATDVPVRWKVADLVAGAIWGLAILSIALWMVSAIHGGPAVMENDHRLAPSLGLIHGYTLYEPRTGGPVLSTLYGWFTALSYLPAALIQNPVWAVYAGVLITLCIFFVPTALLLRLVTRQMGLPTAAYAAALLSFALVTQAVPSLSRSSTMIHADAPAIGAAALSCFFLLKKRSRLGKWENFLLAGLFAGVSIFSKQNMAPFIATAAMWLFFSRTRVAQGLTALAWFLVGAAGITVLSSLLLHHWLGDLGSVFFNLVTIPAHQPYLKIKLFEAVHNLQFQALIFLVLPLVLAAARMLRGVPGEFRRPEWLLISSALALSVTSVMGDIKLGGNINALTPAAYFALLAFSYSLCTLTAPQRSALVLAQPVGLAMAVLAVIFGAVSAIESASSLRHNHGRSHIEEVYRFDRLHPAAVYFPEYPLAILAAEGRLYNFSWGLEDRAVAGFKLSPDQFVRFIPNTDVAAVDEGVPYMERQFLSMCQEDPSLRPIPGLEGFKLCRLARPPQSATKVATGLRR